MMLLKGQAFFQKLSISYKNKFRLNTKNLHTVLGNHSTGKNRVPFADRCDLKRAQRIVVKLGSAVITRSDQSGIALGRLASIVEQVSQLQNEGKQMLMVTSGAVAFGKQKLRAEMRMGMSMRETLSPNHTLRQALSHFAQSRAAAAVGQSELNSLYDAMFSQYGVNIAQVLVTNPDFYIPENRFNLRSTIMELLALNILPVVNTNDTVLSPKKSDLGETIGKAEKMHGKEGGIHIRDNDSLAAHLAVEVGADLLVLLSDVDGIYTAPPTTDGAKLLQTYCPLINGNIVFGEKSNVGLGGMESKVRAASWALERGVSVVICNGKTDLSLSRVLEGRKIGTFFSHQQNFTMPVETLAVNARRGSQVLQSLSCIERAEIILQLAESLQTQKEQIMAENAKDMKYAEESGLDPPLLARLKLTSDKLENLSDGLRQIAHSSHKILGKILKRTCIAEGMVLDQITVPIGVLLVIFESRPDCLPQVASLAIATGNGLLLKGGKESYYTNNFLFKLLQQSLSIYNASDAVSLLNTREEVSELLELEKYIDLIIPRGSSNLVKSIQERSKGIPVLAHSEGICHVYVDVDAQLEKAIRIVKDSKCDYAAACNAMETLLLHSDLIHNNFFADICNALQKEGVNILSGPCLHGSLTFAPPLAKSMRVEYGALNCAIEVVEDVNSAIHHINTYGSGHTDTIVTENDKTAEIFIKTVGSACVFHNCSTRFSDGYRFGLGAEVGISTSRIHARGPVGIEGLLTTKWILKGTGNIVQDFSNDGCQRYIHESIPIS